MPFAVERERAVLACLLSLFLCRAVLACAIIPLWQDPDSPTHFALIELLRKPDGGTEVARIEVEGRIFQSMAQYRWIQLYGRPAWNPLPKRFIELQFAEGAYHYQPLYYGLGAAALRFPTPSRNIEASYWRLRALSVALGVATLVLAWAGTRLMFGSAVAIGSTAIAALHPQFLVNAIGVNSTVLTAFWGAFAWWQIGRAIRGNRPEMSLLLIMVAAVAIVLSKRGGIPFAGGATLVAAWLFLRHAVVITPSKRRLLAVIGIAAIVLVAAPLLFSGRAAEALHYWLVPPGRVQPMYSGWLPDPIEHGLRSIDHIWLIAGWNRYEAPAAWEWVARVVSLAGMAGALMLIVEASTVRWQAAIAWLLVTVQVLAIVFLGYFGLLAVTTGRYMDPVLAPMSVLLWIGFARICPGQMRPYAGVILLSTLFVMDVTAFTSVLIPAYVPW